MDVSREEWIDEKKDGRENERARSLSPCFPCSRNEKVRNWAQEMFSPFPPLPYLTDIYVYVRGLMRARSSSTRH